MAVRAFDQTLLHLVVKGCGELSFHLCVTSEAQCRSRTFEQRFGVTSSVNTVATGAAQMSFAMLGVCECLFAAAVALEANAIHLHGIHLREIENLARIAFAHNVRCSGSVACCAGVVLSGAHIHRMCMGIVGEVFHFVGVASCADALFSKIARSGHCGL